MLLCDKKNEHKNLNNKKKIISLKDNNGKILSIVSKPSTYKYKNFQPVFLDYKVYNKNYIIGNKGKKISKRKNAQKAIQKKVKTKKIIFSSKIYSLIHIDAKNSRYTKPPKSDFLLDNYDYETVIKYDNRDFWRILYISILEKEYIINIILFKTPMDIRVLRICLFIFNYSSDLAFNTIFYNNQNISDKYHYKGDILFLFTVINNLLESAITTGVGIVLVNVFQHMIDSRRNFEEIFRAEERNMRNNKNYKVSKEKKLEIFDKIKKLSCKLKCKIIIFIICEFSLMIFFYYFVTSFCDVYKETQITWLYDFLTSFIISLIGEFLLAFVIAIFYTLSIRYKIKFIYNIALFFYHL